MKPDAILEVEVKPDADDNHIVARGDTQVCDGREVKASETIGVTAETLVDFPNLCEDCRRVLQWERGEYEPEFESLREEARSPFGRSLETIIEQDGLFEDFHEASTNKMRAIHGAALAGTTVQRARNMMNSSYKRKYIGVVCPECDEVYPEFLSDTSLFGGIKEASCGHVIEVDAREYHPDPEQVLQGFDSGTSSYTETAERLAMAQLTGTDFEVREVQVYTAKSEVKFHDIDHDIDELATLCGYPANYSIVVAVSTLDIAECGNCGRQRLSAKKKAKA